MSSFEVGGVVVATGVIAGGAVIGAAIVALTPIAASGYAVYKLGSAINNVLLKEQNKALEIEYKKQAQLKIRKEKAIHIHNDIVLECRSIIDYIEKNEVFQITELKDLREKIVKAITEICNQNIMEDIVDLELQNEKNILLVKSYIKELKEDSRTFIRNKENAERFNAYVESVENIYENLKIENYNYIYNICVDKSEDVELRKLNMHLEKLIYELSVALEREIHRFETVPIKSTDIKALNKIFNNIRKEIEFKRKQKLDIATYKNLISSIEIKMDEYYVLQSMMDKEEYKFLMLYLSYKDACNKSGIEFKDEVEFDSYEELEQAVVETRKRLEKMQKCAEVYHKIGKEAYICMAFENELSRLNYTSVTKEKAQRITNKILNNAHIGDELSPFYEMQNDSLMQVYHVSDNVGVQLIIHNDGSSTLETILLNEENEENAKKIQKEHCEKSKRLAQALRENWFIEADFDEVKSPNEIATQFTCTDKENCELEETRIKIDKKREIARQEQKRKNIEKAKRRSMTLK